MHKVISDLTAISGITNKNGSDVVAEAATSALPDADTDVTEVLALLNARLQTLYEALPPRTALVIFTGHSDPRRMAELNAKKAAFETGIRSGKSAEELGDVRWTSADGRALEEEVEKAKRGLLFLGIKDSK